MELHCNKGLAGAPEAAGRGARECAIHPAVRDAFALAIMGASSQPEYGADGTPRDPHAASAREAERRCSAALAELRRVNGGIASYVSESDYFETEWQQSFWGPHYPRLAMIKAKFDPDGVFFTRHGVGSEAWSDDGFTPRA